MLENVYRTLPVVLVFLTDALYAWIWGGRRAIPLLEWMPWISLLALQVLFFYPQRHPWENAVEARSRTWKNLSRDPLTWVSLAFLVLLIIPLFNKGICPGCHPSAVRDGISLKPPAPFLPWCVDIGEHARSIMLFLPSMIAALAVRHALVKRGRRLFLEMLAWNGALLAVYGFIMQGMDAPGPYGDPPDFSIVKGTRWFFSTFGYTNTAGTYFVLMCAISIGIWRQRWNETGTLAAATAKDPVKPKNMWLRANYPLVAAILNFFGALCSLSRAAIIAAFVLLLMSFIYIFAGIFANKRKEKIRSVKGAAWAGLGMMLFLGMVYVFAPEGMSREVGTVSAREVLDRVSGKQEYHSRVATAIFKSYPFFGVGFWGYRHHCLPYMTKEEKRCMQLRGGANVHNDFLQFLCEFGVVGTGLVLAMIALLLMPVINDWYQFYHVSKFTRPGDAPITTTAMYSMPPPPFWTLVGAVIVTVHAFGDCPLRSGSVLCALFTSLAAMDGFLPDREKKAVADVNAALTEPRKRHHHHHHDHHDGDGHDDGHHHHHHHHRS